LFIGGNAPEIAPSGFTQVRAVDRCIEPWGGRYRRRIRRRLRHLRRELRMRREPAHPAVGVIVMATIILITACFVAYTLMAH